MGRAARLRPQRLPEKLRRIREALGLSQSDMLKRLGFEEDIWYTQISGYELGRSEPPLLILLEYARAANLYVEALIDDELDLPHRLPAPARSEGVRRRSR
ncbi:MAG TPA: helix-turn-helix transcriptional regulator [Pyrinomonadaceae bacterium]|nr:helix-turn-helix transcriptional regulator [Pyrinomonadaceae bacterium]HWS86262.1 helix-turn-helix transcriptional regulator [Pyrinomonadaceae bacterium]